MNPKTRGGIAGGVLAAGDERRKPQWLERDRESGVHSRCILQDGDRTC